MKKSRQTINGLSRRRFLQGSAAALAAVGVPTIVPRSVFGATAPSNRIVMGVIGVGGMGTNNLRSFLGRSDTQLVGVCDVDQQHAASAKRLVDERYDNSDCDVYGDFRELTRRPDVDALCVATPDHWHTLTALDAARHGKDCYVEKPLTLTIEEGKALRETFHRHGRILQTGSQQRSDSRFRRGCELVRNGRIGKVHTVEVGIPGNNRQCDPTWEPQPVPPELDYDFWLGPAEWAPYHPQRCHYQFRFVSDYSGGQVTNWGAHHLDIGQWGLGMDESGPVEVTGDGEFPKTGLFTTATRVNFACRYANGVVMTCRTGSRGGTRFIGDEGWIHVNRGVLEASSPAILRGAIEPGEERLYASSNHRENFLDCVRTRRQPICNVEVGHRSATVCHLGNIAMQLKRAVRWDPEREEVIGDPMAASLTGRTPRAPWRY